MRARTVVALPASIVADTPHLREKTAKIGSIARSCSIFGVDQIVIYGDDPDHNQKQDFDTCADILRFLETPQYLRRRLFSIGPGLRFVGILPPLQIPSHNVPRKVRDCAPGDIREGVIAARSGDVLNLDVGLESLVECHGALPVGTRVTVKLTSIKELAGELVDRTKLGISQLNVKPTYWGYLVSKAGALGKLLKDQHWDLKVGTSRYGIPVQDVLLPLSKAFRMSKSTLFAFGSPRMGLREILEQENLDPRDEFHYFVNTVPDQQTATIRTDEAVSISLAILNLIENLAE